MNKLAKIIETMSPKELVLLEKDLQAGTLKRLVEEKLTQLQQGKEKTCPVCGATVYAHEAIKLEFGPSDLRQQAHFDATDCLEHFIQHRLKKKPAPQHTQEL